jgi:tetratricopeptide (TPR) repeat protein
MKHKSLPRDAQLVRGVDAPARSEGPCSGRPPTFATTRHMAACCVAWLHWAILGLGAVAADGPRLNLEFLPQPQWPRAEERLLRCATETDDRWLLRMALAAGGCEEAAARRYEQRLEGWAERLRVEPASETRRLARNVLELLHHEVLRQYRSDADRLHETFESGAYNCVTSAVLYVCLCRRLGIAAAARQWREHVACVVFADGEAITVEPTSPRWLASEHPLPADAAAPQGRPTDAASGQQGSWRPLSSRGLAAAVYYNMGSRALLNGQYAAALQANHTALVLDPYNEAAGRNLLASINNWAVSEAQAGRPDAAERLLRLGLNVAPEHHAFRQNLALLAGQHMAAP